MSPPSTPGPGHGHKISARGFDGYKGHVAIDPDAELITATAVTPGNAGDAAAAADLLAAELPAKPDVPGSEPAPATNPPAAAAAPPVWNAAKQIRSLFSKQLASLTLGDAGAAVIVERAPDGAPGIDLIGFTTLAGHSRLCLAFPSKVGPGAQMYTKSRKLHKVAIEDMTPLVAEVIGEAGIDLSDIDYLIPHQTSARAIRKGTQEFAQRLGAKPKHMVVNLEEYGNTSSTTLFVALHKYLQEGRLQKGDRVMLLALASGIEIGMALFTIDNQVERYGRTH